MRVQESVVVESSSYGGSVKFSVIVDDVSPAVAGVKCPKGRGRPHIRQLDVISGHYSISPHCPSYPMNVQ